MSSLEPSIISPSKILEQNNNHRSPSPETTTINNNNNNNNSNHNNNSSSRKERLRRACTSRPASQRLLYPVAAAKPRQPKREKVELQEQKLQQCSKIITPLLNSSPSELSPSQLPRWELRSMWELASLLNFLHVFRPLLNITAEFTAEELETALITPNSTLDDIHIPLLKAIPPIARMALGRATWVTVLCRKLRDWWHWVADGDIPIVASQGTEAEAYKALDPGTRVVILKALCDIRVEQEDIRNYIDLSIKQGIQLSVFRKERIGGDSHGVSYWYEDDPIIGHRLYREIRKVEANKLKTKGMLTYPTISRQWETVATNLDEFEEVSEKLFSSKSRVESSLGKKLKIDMIPEVEKVHKKRERLLKKQHREATLLDNFYGADGLAPGRSLRDRKPVTYTFDDFDRSINEAIKITKRKQPSPEPTVRKEVVPKYEASTNGRSNGRLHTPLHVSYESPSPKSGDSEYTEEEEYESAPLDRGNRRRQRPRRYSEKEFVEAVSDFEADFDTDDDIVGEAVYDDEYLRSRKQRKLSSSSEGDEEYHWSDENVKDEEEEEDEDEEEADSRSSTENSDRPHRSKKIVSRKTKLRSVDELDSGPRRSRRATINRINYQQYELSDSETDGEKSRKPSASEEGKSYDQEYSSHSQDFQGNEDNQVNKVDQTIEEYNHIIDKEPIQSPQKSSNSSQEVEGVGKRRFLDLNKLAPGTGFDDGPIE
ncbi:hypothetical protein GIB67_004262 [Kingdonia uniflora]|uniref:DDT domain-containing protein DDR4 n=1 Tax=Kingdonia uniflora TaxID=39325 RepID=A0A7J7MR52_9MAGN|nr:hypothetical protein GIB67_004262 [Kingdonia uniflora]